MVVVVVVVAVVLHGSSRRINSWFPQVRAKI